MKNIKSFDQYNESLLATGLAGVALGAAAIGIAGGPAAEKVGKTLGGISKGIKRFKSLVGKTGKDEDLAEQILAYLKKLPTDYIASTNFRADRVYHPIPGNFVFFGDTIFPKDQGKYRVDVFKVSELEVGLHNDPYRVIISKVAQVNTGHNPLQRYSGGIGANDPGVPPQAANLLITANPKADEEMCQLDCSLQIARKIYEKCEEIWNKTNPNTKGAARGGQNTTTPQPRNSGSGKKGGLFRRWTW
jgi:hypothetical protein